MCCRWGQPLGLDLTEKGNGGGLVKELTGIKRKHPCKIILCQVRSEVWLVNVCVWGVSVRTSDR